MVPVVEFARAHGTGPHAPRSTSVGGSTALTLPIRAMAFAAMILLSVASPLAVAQIVAAPGSGAQVVQTQNGLQQVNIAKPSGAGVSVNNYSQFDVPGNRPAHWDGSTHPLSG